jgi:hypothetical protein
MSHDQSWIDARRRKRMEKIDAMPPELRECVKDYGLNIVHSFVECGISKPCQIRHLVETVLSELSPTRGAMSAQGIRRAPGFHGEE